jgi:DNA-binding NarL/FixJ family response regulator
MPAAEPIRVLVLAADAVVRARLRERLEAEGLVACGEAADQATAVAMVLDARPDLCLVVDDLPLNGLAASAALGARAPGVPAVLVGDRPTDEKLLAAVTAGAAGYLDAEAAGPRLTAALCDVLAGLPAFPRRLTTLLMDGLRAPGPSA